MIDEGHGAALRADLQMYGLDLADVWRGRLAPRRVLDLVEHLPDDSALQAQMRGGRHHRGWTVAAYLAAAAVDAEHDTAWVVASANSKKTVRRPPRVERPDGPRGRSRSKALDLSGHPLARPLPAKYRRPEAITKGG